MMRKHPDVVALAVISLALFVGTGARREAHVVEQESGIQVRQLVLRFQRETDESRNKLGKALREAVQEGIIWLRRSRRDDLREALKDFRP